MIPITDLKDTLSKLPDYYFVSAYEMQDEGLYVLALFVTPGGSGRDPEPVGYIDMSNGELIMYEAVV